MIYLPRTYLTSSPPAVHDFPSFIHHLVSASTETPTPRNRGLHNIEEEDDDIDRENGESIPQLPPPRAWHEKLGSAVQQYFQKPPSLPSDWENLAFGAEATPETGSAEARKRATSVAKARNSGRGDGRARAEARRNRWWGDMLDDHDDAGVAGRSEEEDGHSSDRESEDDDDDDDPLAYGDDGRSYSTSPGDYYPRSGKGSAGWRSDSEGYLSPDPELETGFLSGTLKFSGDKFSRIFGGGGGNGHREDIIVNPVLVEPSSRLRPRTSPRSGAGRARASTSARDRDRHLPPPERFNPNLAAGGVEGESRWRARESLAAAAGDTQSIAPAVDHASSAIVPVPVIYIQQHRYVELEGFGLGYWAAGPEGMPIWVPADVKTQSAVAPVQVDPEEG